MGQGLYTALVYGVIDPPTEVTAANGYTDAAVWYQDAEDTATSRHNVMFNSSYEAEPFYRGVVLAVSDEVLAEWWGVARWHRFAILAASLENIAQRLPGSPYDRAVAAWDAIRLAGRAAGVEVPEGRLLLVSDWH